MSLSIQNLSLKKGEKHILHHVSITWERTSMGLVGANGAGKSTLFKCIMAMERPNEGEISFHGQKLSFAQQCFQRRQIGLAYLAQEHWLFHDLSVLDNLKAAWELIHNQSLNAVINHEQMPKFLSILTKVELESSIHQKVNTLSGGEKRRLEVARLLLEKPKMILMDEPFAGLDPKAIRILKNLILNLQKEGINIFISDHQVSHILDICQNIILLHQGEVLLESETSHFMTHPLAKEVYL
jgi:lipopolysaccharide export system ATP-binding protein